LATKKQLDRSCSKGWVLSFYVTDITKVVSDKFDVTVTRYEYANEAETSLNPLKPTVAISVQP